MHYACYVCCVCIFLSPSLSLTLFLFYSLCPVSPFFPSFTQLFVSRMVPFCEPGPSQGFFLLEGHFSFPPTGSRSGFLGL